LEQLSLEESEDVTLFVTEIQEMKRIVPQWES
jgi:dynein heavy chain 1, cytosolic